MKTGTVQVIAAFFIFAGGAAFAGRPLAIDDADPVEQRQFEFELGSVYEHDPVRGCAAMKHPILL